MCCLICLTSPVLVNVYSCFEKGCPTEKHLSVRDNTERHDGLWLFTVASSSSRVFSAMEGGAMNTFLHVLKETKWILSFYKNLLGMSQTTFRHCRVRFYAFLDNLCRNSCMLFFHDRCVGKSDSHVWIRSEMYQGLSLVSCWEFSV